MHDLGPTEGIAASASASRRQASEEARANRAALAGLIKREILPRLVAASPRRAAVKAPSADPLALARSLLSGRTAQARAAIAARIAGGAAAQDLLNEDFAAAARALGGFWERDEYDFVDVTLATRALSDLLRDMAPQAPRPRPASPALLISPAPGDGHTFGAEVAAGIFRLGGWRAQACGFDLARERLAEEWFDVAGFSLSCERRLADLRAAVAQARAASRNPRVKILLGGPVFASRPELAESLGSDLRAPDGDVDVAYAQAVLRTLRLRRA